VAKKGKLGNVNSSIGKMRSEESGTTPVLFAAGINLWARQVKRTCTPLLKVILKTPVALKPNRSQFGGKTLAEKVP